MKDKILVNIKSVEEISQYQKANLNNFLIPLANFCVGYDTLTLKEILTLKTSFYLLINRLLTKDDLDQLSDVLIQINPFIKGIFLEDLGVLEVLDKLDLPGEKIYFANHFGTNYASINAFLKRGFDSMVVSNEITKEEIKEILAKVDKEVILQVYGYNQIMYSRRTLITNYNQEYDLNLALDSTIEENITKKKLKIKENPYGTVIFDENIYNNLELLEFKENVKFYYINTTDLKVEDVLNAIENKTDAKSSRFLNKKTIYKIGDIDE